jgi:hypothetical protein
MELIRHAALRQRAQAGANDGLEDGDLEVTEVEQVADDD